MGAQAALSVWYFCINAGRLMSRVSLIASAVCLAMLMHDSVAQGKVDAVTPGTIVAEPATPSALGVRWPVIGDKNLNATIAVASRRAGNPTWSEGYPRRRAAALCKFDGL